MAPRKVEISLLGDSDAPARICDVDTETKVGEVKWYINSITGVPMEKIKIVGFKGAAMTTLGDAEKLPKNMKVGGVPTLEGIGEEKQVKEVEEPEQEEAEVRQVRAPPPREPRKDRPVEAAPKTVSKETAAAKAAARKAKEAAKKGLAAPAPAAAAPTAAAPAAAPTPQPQQTIPDWLPPFSREQALSFQAECLELFEAVEFQDKLGQLFIDTKTEKVGVRNKLYKELLLEEQKKVLPKYGFEGSPQGVQVMLQAFIIYGYNDDPEIDGNTQRMNADINMDYAATKLEMKREQAKYANWVFKKEEAPKKEEEPAKPAEPDPAPPPAPPPVDLKLPAAQTTPNPLEVALAMGWKAPSKETLLQMVKDLVEGYMQPAFQESLKALPKGKESRTQEAQSRRTALLWSVQGPVIGKYGFPENGDGLVMSGQVFTKEINQDPEIAAANEELFLALAPEVREKREEKAKNEPAPAKAKAAAPAPEPKLELRFIELRSKKVKEASTKLYVEGHGQKVEDIRKIISEATCTQLGAVKLWFKQDWANHDVVSASLENKMTCPPKVEVSGPANLVPGARLLTREQAITIMKEFNERYSKGEFQTKLGKLATLPQKEQREALRDLCFEEQREVLPKYNFEATRDGVLRMLVAFQLVQKDMWAKGNDPEFRALQDLSNYLLDIGTVSERAPKVPEPPPPEEPATPAKADPEPPAKPANTAMSWMNAMMMDLDEEDEDAETDEEAVEEIWSAPPPETGPSEAPPLETAKAEPQDPAVPSKDVKSIVLKLINKNDAAITLVYVGDTCAALRQGISEALGGMNLSDIKLIRKRAESMISLEDVDKIPQTAVMVRGPPAWPRGKVIMGVELALDLQFELRALYKSQAFQSAFKKFLAETEGKKPGVRSLGVMDLSLAEQKKIMPKYGFEPSREGVGDMITFYTQCYPLHAEVQAAANETNSLLAIPAPVQGQTAAASTRWTVVGGGDKGGIVVRKTADLKSPELGRISTGSVLRQKKLQGDRLEYAKIAGTGPETGWVSLNFKGTPLVTHVDDKQ